MRTVSSGFLVRMRVTNGDCNVEVGQDRRRMTHRTIQRVEGGVSRCQGGCSSISMGSLLTVMAFRLSIRGLGLRSGGSADPFARGVRRLASRLRDFLGSG